MTPEDRVRRFLIEKQYWDGPLADLSDDLPLIEERVIDSLGIRQLISFVEREFRVEVEDEEILPENFGTIAGLAAYVSRKGVLADLQDDSLDVD